MRKKSEIWTIIALKNSEYLIFLRQVLQQIEKQQKMMTENLVKKKY